MLDLAMMHRRIVEELAAKRSLRESMDRIISECEAARPHKAWSRLRKLPYGDLTRLRQRIERPFREEPPSEKLAGLWFGLFNPVYEHGPVADIYVCGSKRFTPDPHSNEWAVRPDWWPGDRCAESEILAKIYKIAYRNNGLGNDAEYPLCLAYGAFAVRELLDTINPKLVLESVGPVGVAVGFDSGDFVLLGKVTARGLTYQYGP